MPSTTGNSKVFLDSSVLIAAVLSSSGGSFYILNQWRDRFEFQINKFVFEEIEEVLSSKFSNQQALKSRLLLLLGLTNVTILDNPPKKSVQRVVNVIAREDAPILSSALEHSAFLITLDNDFFTKKVSGFVKGKKLRILKPKDFIARIR